MNDIIFRPISKYYQQYLNNYLILNSFHSQKYDQNQMNSIVLGDNRYRFSFLTYDIFINLRNRAYLIFLYTEIEFYFYKCLRAIYIEDPRKLKGKEIKIDLNLENNKKTIIEAKAEKEIKKFLINWNTVFDKTKEHPYSIRHQIKNEDIEMLKEFKQIRNIYAHRNGRVDQIFLDKTPNPKFKLEDKIKLSRVFFDSYEDPIINLMDEFDRAFIKEYPSFEFKSEEKLS